MKALLVQPPIYDTQYYAEWSMPSGLLKVSTWLRELGYELRLNRLPVSKSEGRGQTRNPKDRTGGFHS